MPYDNEMRKQWSYIEKDYLKNTWRPINEEEIIRLSKSDLLIMNNGRDILKILIKSLEEFNTHKNGLKVIKHVLWNETGDKWIHKKENELSNLMAYHLNNSLCNMGIFVNGK